MGQSIFECEVDQNYAIFESALSAWLVEHEGQFALMRHGELIGFYPAASVALKEGSAAFPDRVFSIQEVTDRPVDLGFFSHAVDTRIA